MSELEARTSSPVLAAQDSQLVRLPPGTGHISIMETENERLNVVGAASGSGAHVANRSFLSVASLDFRSSLNNFGSTDRSAYLIYLYIHYR